MAQECCNCAERLVDIIREFKKPDVWLLVKLSMLTGSFVSKPVVHERLLMADFCLSRRTAIDP